MRRHLVALLAFFALAWAVPAYATNTTCANAEPFIIGSESASYFLPASGALYFKTHLAANRSYIFWVYPPFEDASEGATAVSVALFTSTTCAVAASGTSTTEREPLDNITGADVDQIAIKTTTSGTFVLRVTNGVANGYTIHVVAMDTTLFSPWWFVGGANQSFITMRNNMDTSTSVTVNMYGGAGTICGTTTFTLAANATTFVRVNDFAGCVTAVLGSAAILYWGPPNGIGANTTVIDATQGISFDEPFKPRIEWSISKR